MSQRWICRNCREVYDTNQSYPPVRNGCPACRNPNGTHRWIKSIVTDQPVHYICKYCNATCNTARKTYEELKPCSRNPNSRKYHVLIKR
jgi:hypothetical protein